MYGKIMEHSSEIIIVFDEQGNITDCSRAAAEELGYFRGTESIWIEAILLSEFSGGRDYKTVAANINERKSTVCYRKNGTCFRAKARVCVEEETGKYILFASDIEKYMELEQEINLAREAAKQAMIVRNEFVANVTHELRTPVNGIKGHVENLKDTFLTSEQRKTLDIIENCCNNMSAMINNILDFSKLEAGKVELEERKFELREAMDKIISANMAAVNEKGLRFSLDIDEKIPRFLIGDELRLTQILNNLLSNAIKFTSVGFVKVEVAQTFRFGDEIELFFLVVDSGIGISKEEQVNLFQSFSQVDNSITRRYGGTGLGLSITKELVELMNGKVYLESEKGRGSNFSFSVRMHVPENESTSIEYKKEITKFMESASREGADEAEEYYHFGSLQNREEIDGRMEKLVLCIELNAWEKAELWLEELKRLVENSDSELKRVVLRLGMAIRKENYEASIEKYEILKNLLEDRIGECRDGKGD